jgi:hypothetical protein
MRREDGRKNGRKLYYAMRAGYAAKHYIFATFSVLLVKYFPINIALKKRYLRAKKSFGMGCNFLYRTSVTVFYRREGEHLCL